jgi:hypothetical protein
MADDGYVGWLLVNAPHARIHIVGVPQLGDGIGYAAELTLTDDVKREAISGQPSSDLGVLEFHASHVVPTPNDALSFLGSLPGWSVVSGGEHIGLEGRGTTDTLGQPLQPGIHDVGGGKVHAQVGVSTCAGTSTVFGGVTPTHDRLDAECPTIENRPHPRAVIHVRH